MSTIQLVDSLGKVCCKRRSEVSVSCISQNGTSVLGQSLSDLI